MAGRRRRSSLPTAKQWRQHPIRSYKRLARKIDVSRAAWLKENNEIKAARDKARLDRGTELAKKRARKATKKTQREKDRKARMEAAQLRRSQGGGAQVLLVRAQAPAPVYRTTAAASRAGLCGAGTEDGTPCQRPVTDGPCGMRGHNRERARRTRQAARAQ